MAGKGGKKEKREARLRDITQDSSGKVIYTGELWRIADAGGPGSGLRQRMLLISSLGALALIVLGSGCIDARNAMGSFYVVLPYIGEVSALFGLAWNAVKLIYTGSGVRTYVLEHAKPRIPGACRILTVCAAAGLILSILYIVLNGSGEKPADGIAYLLLKFAAAVLSEWYRRLFLSTAWEKVS
jgi:hypothetical protein